MRRLVAGLLLLQQGSRANGTPALLPPQVYSDQAILTSSLRKQVVDFCKRRKTDYRCQEDATSMGLKALSSVTPVDLDLEDLPLSDEELVAMLDIATHVDNKLSKRNKTRAEKPHWSRLQLDDTGGAYWTTGRTGGASPDLFGFGSWQKAGAWERPSCAVVGSGGALSGRGLGPEIDAHDVVVVVNNQPSEADHADMGSRMDVFFQSAVGVLWQMGPNGARMVVTTGGHDAAVNPICHTSGEDAPRCSSRFKAMIVRNLLYDRPGHQNGNYMYEFANSSEVALGWSGKMVTTLVHHLRREGLPDQGKPSTGFHALVTMALLCESVELYGFTGTGTVDGRTEGVIHNIEGEHRVLQRLINKRIPQSEFPDETSFRAWATTNVSVVL